MSWHGESVRILIPLLFIALISAQTYYLSYGVVVDVEEGWWNAQAEALMGGPAPNTVEAYRVVVRPLLNNTTATLFIPLEGTLLKADEGVELVAEGNRSYVRVFVDTRREFVAAGSLGKPVVYAGRLLLPPKEDAGPSYTMEVVEEVEREPHEVKAEAAGEGQRERVREVLQVKSFQQGLNLPSLADVLLLLIIAGVLLAISLVVKHYKPKEREGREPINPYVYEVEFKKPPKGA